MGLHDKHRERVRDRIMKSGFDDLEPHQLLEFMLFSSIPRGDTNEIAHKLINRFGSFNNVLEATAKELMMVDGVGPACALNIASHLAVIKKYLISTFDERTVLNSTEDVTSFFEALCMGNKYETAYALFADKSKRVITHAKLSEGSLDSTGIYTDKLVSEAVLSKAFYVAVAHNHPSGYLQPSPGDFDTARKIVEALNSVNKFLLDFVVVDHLNSFSFRDEGFIVGGDIRNPYKNEAPWSYAPVNLRRKTGYETGRPAYVNDDA